ncbi:MAG: GntR family transcriptional regulator [Bacteroidetes bacterium]|nr:MAG: GntR family transcriptional regulator [Bacteroidota bacterium]
MPLTPGTYQLLTIQSRQKAGYRLAAPDGSTVWVPSEQAAPGWRPGQEAEVFVFQDREGKWAGTTQKPKIQLNQFGFLEVKSLSPFGAFLDWGIAEKDLLVPHREQPEPMQAGLSYLVYLYLDPASGRLTASGYLQRFLDTGPPDLALGEAVDLFIWEATDLGVNVIVNHRYKGLVYANETFVRVRLGDQRQGYVKAIRPDYKLDIQLHKPGYESVTDAQTQLLHILQAAGGFLPLTDKSPPAEISRRLEMSKKVFKKALGGLYKARKVRLEPDGVYLNQTS